jgi:hypothetical protein
MEVLEKVRPSKTKEGRKKKRNGSLKKGEANGERSMIKACESVGVREDRIEMMRE